MCFRHQRCWAKPTFLLLLMSKYLSISCISGQTWRCQGSQKKGNARRVTDRPAESPLLSRGGPCSPNRLMCSGAEALVLRNTLACINRFRTPTRLIVVFWISSEVQPHPHSWEVRYPSNVAWHALINKVILTQQIFASSTKGQVLPWALRMDINPDSLPWGNLQYLIITLSICSLLSERCLYVVCQILKDPHSVPATVLGVQEILQMFSFSSN